jgi:hypothetical protein
VVSAAKPRGRNAAASGAVIALRRDAVTFVGADGCVEGAGGCVEGAEVNVDVGAATVTSTAVELGSVLSSPL